MLTRGIGEIANLFWLFQIDKGHIARWRTADRKTRLNDYGPAAIRKAIESSAHNPIDAQRYPTYDAIFNSTNADIYFTEYYTARAGGLKLLKFPPMGRRIIAGFVTTNTSELKGMDWLRKQFEAASQYVDMDQLGIAPQCDFASTEDGNAIIEKDSGW